MAAAAKSGHMKRRPPPYPDMVPKDQIQTVILKMTGTLVTKRRIGDWISQGEIRMISVPCCGGHKWYTRRTYLEGLIARYAVS
jgi:hypothetical protein